MNNMFNLLLKSSAFWTALFSAIGLILLKYLGVPEDIWNAIFGVLTVIVTILTGDGIAKATGLQIARSQQEYWSEREKYAKK